MCAATVKMAKEELKEPHGLCRFGGCSSRFSLAGVDCLGVESSLAQCRLQLPRPGGLSCLPGLRPPGVPIVPSAAANIIGRPGCVPSCVGSTRRGVGVRCVV
jgi:hypothetical protein